MTMSLFQHILISMVIIIAVASSDIRESFKTNSNLILLTHARQLVSAISISQAEANRHHQVESANRLQILKHSPSSSTARVRRNQETSANMRASLSSLKRSATEANESRPIAQKLKKVFKTSGRAFASNNRQPVPVATGVNVTRQDSWRQANDTNNNSIVASGYYDTNNNIEPPGNWRRNIDSVNGTVDVSSYERDDIDRLYGDALLVYFKNFNETLPARRELISINGTITSSSPNMTPIYRSVPASEPK